MGVVFFAILLGYAMLFMLAVPHLRLGGALMSAYAAALLAAYTGVICARVMIPTAYVLMIGGFLSLIGCGVFARKQLMKRLCTPTLVLYALLCFVCCVYAHGFTVSDHDSLSFWARVVKELFVFDSFYIHADSTMFHTDYIPLLASLQYCLVRTFGWKDAYLTYTSIACVAVSACAVCDVFEKKSYGFLAGLVFVLGSRAFGFTPLDLRADGLMCSLFSAALIVAACDGNSKETNAVPIVLACGALTGMKIYTGLMYALLIAFMLLLVGKRRAALLALLTACVMHFSWSIVYNASTLIANGSVVSLSTLFAGNPRTGKLFDRLDAEHFKAVGQLIDETGRSYLSSNLLWVWLFWIPPVILKLLNKEKLPRGLRLLPVLLFAAALFFTVGLFASFFVQAETAGASNNYLRTATTPLLIGALFLTLWQSHRKRVFLPFALLLAVALIVLSPLSLPVWQQTPLSGGPALAKDFYENEISFDQEDFGKRAAFIECSWEATEVRSQSAKTHSYAYYALPVRVIEPIYLKYGDYTQLEDWNGEALLQQILSSDASLLILRIEDDLYWEETADALGLDPYEDEAIGIYDIVTDGDETHFVLRAL